MTFELIEAEKGHYPKALMCRVLGLSRSGHHAFRTRSPSRRALDDQRLNVLVAAIFAELGGRYGAPRIQQELRRRGERTSWKRVAASMVRQGLRARPRRRWKRTTDSSHREPIWSQFPACPDPALPRARHDRQPAVCCDRLHLGALAAAYSSR